MSTPPPTTPPKPYRLTVGDGIRVGIGLAIVYGFIMAGLGFLNFAVSSSAANSTQTAESSTAEQMSTDEMTRTGKAIQEFLASREASGASIQFHRWGVPGRGEHDGSACWMLSVDYSVNGEKRSETFRTRGGAVIGAGG